MSAEPVLRHDAAVPSGQGPTARLRVAALPRARRPRRGARRESVARPRLLRPLLETSPALVAIVAPAGYGKSTVLEQWCAVEPRPFAWVTLTSFDDEAGQLAAAIAASLGDALPGSAIVPSPLVGTLARAIAALDPVVIVLDDVHVLRSADARAAVAAIAAHVPSGSTLALASRSSLPVGLGRLRAMEDVHELGAADLAMTHIEAAKLLRNAGLRLDDAEAGRLMELTLGWPAALALAARSLRDSGRAADAIAADDHMVAEYVHEEILSALSGPQRTLLTRTSVLDRLSADACDAVLDTHDSGAVLRDLAGANVPVFPLDSAHLQFSPHPIVSEILRAEMRRTDPELVPGLHRRASAWYEREHDIDRAVAHALDAHDVPRVAELVARHAPSLMTSGGAAVVARWLERLADDEIAAHAALALAAAASRLIGGERDMVQAWVATAARTLGPVTGEAREGLRAGIAVLEATVARDGVEGLLRETQQAYAGAGERGPWRPLACFVHGSALTVAGRFGEARERLGEGTRRTAADAPLIRSLCLAELALLAAQDDDWEEAGILAAKARAAIDRGGLRDHPVSALTFAVCALTLVQLGRVDAAGHDAATAVDRAGALTDAVPWYAAMVHVTLARAKLRLSDAPAAREHLTAASRAARRIPDALTLRGWIDDTWAQADDYAAHAAMSSSKLTLAELRVLRFLPSHLVFREIAARLHVSTNTVKTQAHAVYRKLGVSSRSEAVLRAAEVGLIDV